jgi:hypothetical protein
VALTDPRAAQEDAGIASALVGRLSSIVAGGARSIVGSFAFAAALPRLWASDARRGAMSQPDLSQAM